MTIAKDDLLKQIDSSNKCKWSCSEFLVLSKTQRRIFELSAADFSNAQIKQLFNLEDRHISACICFTLAGNMWLSGNRTGGRNEYLSDSEQLDFQMKLLTSSLDFDCLKTCEAYNLAYDLKYQRYQRAWELAKIIKLNFAKARHIKKMINKLYPSMPCSSWLNHMCGQNGITIKTPQTFEAAREKHCHINTIRAFFTKHEHLLKRDPHLLWNADETLAASSRKYKVLINTPNVSPITVMRPLEPYITGIFPYNAAGHQFDPFIILHDLINLQEELKNFYCFFMSQKSGWCTIKIFEFLSISFEYFYLQIRSVSIVKAFQKLFGTKQ